MIDIKHPMMCHHWEVKHPTLEEYSIWASDVGLQQFPHNLELKDNNDVVRTMLLCKLSRNAENEVTQAIYQSKPTGIQLVIFND